MKEILFATTNPSKYEPFHYNWEKLKLEGFQLVTAKDLSPVPSVKVDEDTGTFDGDSLKKAKTYCQAYNRTVISLDRGIEFPALNNWPGTKTKEAFVGDEKMTLGIGLNRFENDQRNSQVVLDKVAGRDRTVVSVYGIAVVCPDGSFTTDIVRVNGTAAPELRVTKVGYYYDWFFIPPGMTTTLSELSPQEYLDYTATVLWPITPKISDFLLSRL